MTNRQNQIHKLLEAAFEPLYLDVINESDRHRVPQGSESHFKIVIASPAFEGLSLILRHRKIHEVLKEPLAAIHALSIAAYTPKEWEAQGETAPASPPCRGGEKKS